MVETVLPEFPPCPIKGHDDVLTYLHTTVQTGAGTKAYMLECATGRYRFFFIPDVYERLHTMARFSRPRWGWST